MKDPHSILRFIGKVLIILATCVTVLYLVVVIYGMLIERTWISVRTLDLNKPSCLKIVHLTDIHYKGEKKYLARVVNTVNRLEPDIVCITGDIVEESGFMDEAMEILTRIKSPLYGIPGNHDYWSEYPLERMPSKFQKTGGAWLCDTNTVIRNGTIEITGNTGAGFKTFYTESSAITRRILLVHYPSTAVSAAGTHRYDIILAGHTHGGQVRLPFGNSILSYCVEDKFDRGLFKTSAGPLYVNPGIGTYYHDIRLFCRPEITAINL